MVAVSAPSGRTRSGCRRRRGGELAGSEVCLGHAVVRDRVQYIGGRELGVEAVDVVGLDSAARGPGPARKDSAPERTGRSRKSSRSDQLLSAACHRCTRAPSRPRTAKPSSRWIGVNLSRSRKCATAVETSPTGNAGIEGPTLTMRNQLPTAVARWLACRLAQLCAARKTGRRSGQDEVVAQPSRHADDHVDETVAHAAYPRQSKFPRGYH